MVYNQKLLTIAEEHPYVIAYPTKNMPTQLIFYTLVL